MSNELGQEENIRVVDRSVIFGYFDADYYHDDGDDRVYFFRIDMEDATGGNSVTVEDLGKMTCDCALEKLQKHVQLRNIEMANQYPRGYLRFPPSQRNPSALPFMYNSMDGKYIIRLVEY